MGKKRVSSFSRIVCGVDEVGRGPLAGPVVAAAVILDRSRPIEGLADSKALSAAARRRLCAIIMEHAEVSVATASPAVIDRLNIRRASLWAMAKAVAGLPPVDAALVDGVDAPDIPGVRVRPMVKGDARSASVAAASIVAKVVRDDLMCRLAEADPRYSFERHKGYPTLEHRAALLRHGPSHHHRLTFAPVRAALASAPPRMAEHT